MASHATEAASPADHPWHMSADACSTQVINAGWKYKQRDTSKEIELELANFSQWTDATHFPSEIHAELVANGTIIHPYKCQSDTEYQWVGEEEWLYATEFTPDSRLKRSHLLFEGLDTYCNVYINGKLLLQTQNMLRSYALEDVKPNAENKIVILLHFLSAKLIAKKLEAEYGVRRAGSCNLGDPSRVYSRKAQYHWRWDWGPEVMTVGPWRPVIYKTYTTSIRDFQVNAEVDKKLSKSLTGCLTFAGSGKSVQSLSLRLRDANGVIIKQQTRQLTESERIQSEASVIWELGTEIELWWPIGYGPQNLYTLESAIMDTSGRILDTASRRIGFRNVRLVQDPLEGAEGTTFLFEINHLRIFMGGSNWVPCHYLLTTVTDDDYRQLLKIAVEGNQNMIRVWSGGVYEPPVFYDTCDELGILVWQDFCGFACGVYPAHDAYVQEVTAEAEENVKLLAHHPSIILWCGNNEDYQQIMQWGEEANLPARDFYETHFPAIVKRNSPGVPYWPGSPFGGKEWYQTDDLTIGDVHEWHAWCGVSPGEYYQNYDILAGRFISEFGLPAFPCKPTVDSWLEGVDPSQHHPQSQTMAHHCRAGSFERRFAMYMNENFRMTGDLETYAFLTQVMQAEGLGWAYRSWRRRWQGPGHEYTSGVLVWQLNDAWPVTSWALVDHFKHKKPAFYVIARELEPITVGIAREVEKNRINDRPRQFYEFGAFRNVMAKISIWVSNLSQNTVRAKLKVDYYDMKSEKIYHSTDQMVSLLPNRSTDVLIQRALFPPPLTTDPSSLTPLQSLGERHVELDRTHTVIIHARLVDETTGTVLARTTNWPEPYKSLEIPDPGLKVTVGSDTKSLVVETTRPAKCVFLSVTPDSYTLHGPINFKNNAFDVFPGDPQLIKADGAFLGHHITVQRLGSEKPIEVMI